MNESIQEQFERVWIAGKVHENMGWSEEHYRLWNLMTSQEQSDTARRLWEFKIRQTSEGGAE